VSVEDAGDLVRVLVRPREARGPMAIRALATLIAWGAIVHLLQRIGVRPTRLPLPLLAAFMLGALVIVERWCWVLFGRQVIESDGRRVRARRVLFGLGLGRWLPIDPAAKWTVEHVRSPKSSLLVIESAGEPPRRLAIDLPPHQARAAIEPLARRGLAHTFD